MFTYKNRLTRIFSHIKNISVIAYIAVITSPVFASSTDPLPWDTPASKVEDWLTGSIAKVVAILLIAISGIMFAHGEHGGAFKRVMGVVFGISIAIGAVTLATTLGFSGAEV